MDKDIHFKWLPAELIVDGFVANDDKCKYERYLLELANKSSFFRGKISSGEFLAPKSESDGECDCIGDGFQMDFKLAESQSMMQAKSIFSLQRVRVMPGVTLLSCSKSAERKEKKKDIDATVLLNALIDYSTDSLFSLYRNTDRNLSAIERDVYRFLEVLSTEKNLLLFLPIEFSIEESDLRRGNAYIVRELWRIMNHCMTFRKEVVEDRETYLTYVFQEAFTIVEYTGTEFVFRETVPVKMLPTYCYLMDYVK